MLDKFVLWIYTDLRLNKWVNFKSSESRWNFFSALFAIDLFLISLVPTLIPLFGGKLMSPIWVFISLLPGILILGLLIIFLVYFRRHPAEDKTILNDMNGILDGMNTKLDKLESIEKAIVDLTNEIRADRESRNGK